MPKELSKHDDYSAYPPSDFTSAVPSHATQVSNALDLFHDEMNDNDDIFGSTIPNVSKKVSPEPKKPTDPDPSTSTATKASLFGDDIDDDDLFGGGPPPLPVPSKALPSKKPATKLFLDDSSDDDLFGGGGGGKKEPPKSNPTATKSVVLETKENKTKNKLFSDSEGGDTDDDLFGSKSKPKRKAH